MKASGNRKITVMLVLRKIPMWHPPTRFFFYPLYHRMRRRWRLPCIAAYIVIWTLSGLLHGGLVLAFGHPAAAAVVTLIFVGLGFSGSGAIILKNRQRRRRTAQLLGQELSP